MFGAHLIISLSIMALAFGVGLYIWSFQLPEGRGYGIAKYFGLVIIVLSIVNPVCAWYASQQGPRMMMQGPPKGAVEEMKKAMQEKMKERAGQPQQQPKPN